MTEREALKRIAEGKDSIEVVRNLAREALAQPVVTETHKHSAPHEEPVAWVCRHKEDLKYGKTTLLCTTDKEMANAWLSDYKEGYAWLIPIFDKTQRPSRSDMTWVHATEWRGLTDEEKKEIYNKQRGFPDVCKAIETKLKAKNFAEEKNT